VPQKTQTDEKPPQPSQVLSHWKSGNGRYHSGLLVLPRPPRVVMTKLLKDRRTTSVCLPAALCDLSVVVGPQGKTGILF
jgi:hypothetical protein